MLYSSRQLPSVCCTALGSCPCLLYSSRHLPSVCRGKLPSVCCKFKEAALCMLYSSRQAHSVCCTALGNCPLYAVQLLAATLCTLTFRISIHIRLFFKIKNAGLYGLIQVYTLIFFRWCEIHLYIWLNQYDTLCLCYDHAALAIMAYIDTICQPIQSWILI